ncbi:MAG: nicotinate-nucleotide--dimethylbenzimidazole phosphoribosyltransferase [Methyloligellaceae bacterium]
MQSFESFEQLSECLFDFPKASHAYQSRARRRQKNLTKPPGSLGRLEELAVWLAGWQQRECPKLERVHTLIFAGNHGVAQRGVSAFPPSVTEQMVRNFTAGGAAINQLCQTYESKLNVIPLHLDQPTQDFTSGPAMSREECTDAVNRGVAAVPGDADLVLLGEMGIGNTTVAAAMAAALFGGLPGEWVGPGTGVNSEGLAHKSDIVQQGLDHHRESLKSPFDVLRCFGGREQAALVGAIIGARNQSIPILLDGFIVCAAASILSALESTYLDHCRVAHNSAEPGHEKLLRSLDKTAIFDLDLRLGEASGAALALGILRGAIACHNGMAQFEEAAVDKKIEPDTSARDD